MSIPVPSAVSYLEPQVPQRYCSACRKNLDLTAFAANRSICNLHHNAKPLAHSSVSSPEAALYQMKSMDFCGRESKKPGRRSLDIYVDYDALVQWLDQRKDIDPRVDRVRRTPKPDGREDEGDPARKQASREARRVRDFILIGTDLLFINKTVSVGSKLQWRCQSRCSQSDRLNNGRLDKKGPSESRPPSTGRTRYPCQGTTTFSLLHQQPGQRQLLHLMIKHDYIHGPYHDRTRDSQSPEPPEWDLQIIDPCLQKPPPEPSDEAAPSSSNSQICPDLEAVAFSAPDDLIVEEDNKEEQKRLSEEVHQLLAEDQARSYMIKEIVMDQLALGTNIQFFRTLFGKRKEIMDDLEPLANLRKRRLEGPEDEQQSGAEQSKKHKI